MAELVESASIQLFMVICGTDTRLQFIPEAHITELDEFWRCSLVDKLANKNIVRTNTFKPVTCTSTNTSVDHFNSSSSFFDVAAVARAVQLSTEPPRQILECTLPLLINLYCQNHLHFVGLSKVTSGALVIWNEVRWNLRHKEFEISTFRNLLFQSSHPENSKDYVDERLQVHETSPIAGNPEEQRSVKTKSMLWSEDHHCKTTIICPGCSLWMFVRWLW